MKTYQDTLNFLYQQLPIFQRDGAVAIKPGLQNIEALCTFLGHPEEEFKSIHVAGTNGKGSTSHLLSSILQETGYKVGLHTSPHLKDFRERIKIDGQEMPEEDVVSFVERVKPIIEDINPSFFELTAAMAFDYFAKEQVDIAIIEVGMGGRLDATNIITPEICAITSIGLDHIGVLGDTLSAIAGEKAGIIKAGVPVAVGNLKEEALAVVKKKAIEKNAPLLPYQQYDLFDCPLKGMYQESNFNVVLTVCKELLKQGWNIAQSNIEDGFKHVTENTGLKGRWQIIQDRPKVIMDVGHNEEAIRVIVTQLQAEQFEHLHIVWGMASDKDASSIVALLPQEAHYYLCRPNIPRGMQMDELKKYFDKTPLNYTTHETVEAAYQAALQGAKKEDLIYVGGSSFVVAEVIP